MEPEESQSLDSCQAHLREKTHAAMLVVTIREGAELCQTCFVLYCSSQASITTILRAPVQHDMRGTAGHSILNIA